MDEKMEAQTELLNVKQVASGRAEKESLVYSQRNKLMSIPGCKEQNGKYQEDFEYVELELPRKPLC